MGYTYRQSVCKLQQIVLMVFGVLTAFCSAFVTLFPIALLFWECTCYLCESPGERTTYLESGDKGSSVVSATYYL